MLDVLPPHHRLFYQIRYYCGLRPGETIALRWSDYRNGEFHVSRSIVEGVEGSTKTDQARTVPVHPVVARALNDQSVRQLGDNRIVLNYQGQPYTTASGPAKALVRAMQKTGVRYRNPYNVRHACATRMLEAGMKPGYCASVLGHSLQVFFQTYARWINAEESAEQARIWATLD